MLENSSWIILIPAWLAVLIISAKFIGNGFAKRTIVLMSISSIIVTGIYSLIGVMQSFHYKTIDYTHSFISIENINFSMGIYIDILSSLLALTISIITLAIYIYSAFYMEKEKSFSRFYSLMNLFNASMLGFIFAPNLFQMLICWEIMGTLSYLLIGFWYEKPSVSSDSKRVFLINILGDIPLFASFVIVSALTTVITGDTTLISVPFSEINTITSLLIAATTPQLFTIICFLFLIASLVKSAQFPFNSWLINAMSAPTPVSSLIHSSTLVIAGAFLLVRIFPIVASSSIAMKYLLYFGIITAIITSLSSIVQTNIKKALAYSTSAQLGLVFLSIGCYNPPAAVIYLIAHAFIKAVLFMSSGIAIKLVNNKNIMFMGGLRQNIPTVAISFLIGALALSGIGFCGFNAKSILTNTFCTTMKANLIFGFIGLLTTLYIFRLYFIVFENKISSNNFSFRNKKNYILGIASTLFLSLIIILLSIFLPAGRLCPLYILNILTIIIAYYIYNKKHNFNNIQILHNLFVNGFYISKIYYWGEIIFYKYFVKLILLLDKYILGGIEYLIKNISYNLSTLEHKTQTNNFQMYIASGIWNLVTIIATFIFSYYLIINFFGV